MVLYFNKIRIYSIIIIQLLLFVSGYGQKQISITIDDPNTYTTPLLSWQDRNNKILNTLDKHNLKAALFVCGMRINDENGKELLIHWDKKNHLICNHSFSHWFFNSKSISTYLFAQDFLKNDSLINGFKNYTKLFRFPYLKEGNNAEKRDSMREILSENGYKNGYVTIDASDWYIDSKINEVLKNNPKADLSVYKNYYIKHILNRAHYYDSLSNLVLKKTIPHTLLIHHSLLNALFLEDLIFALKKEGWIFIDAKISFSDNAYNLKPLIEPCGESLIWQLAKLDSNLAKYLRYPAEDSRYEKEPLEEFIQKSISTSNNKIK
jgi:hypothetical protein